MTLYSGKIECSVDFTCAEKRIKSHGRCGIDLARSLAPTDPVVSIYTRHLLTPIEVRYLVASQTFAIDLARSRRDLPDCVCYGDVGFASLYNEGYMSQFHVETTKSLADKQGFKVFSDIVYLSGNHIIYQHLKFVIAGNWPRFRSNRAC